MHSAGKGGRMTGRISRASTIALAALTFAAAGVGVDAHTAVASTTLTSCGSTRFASAVANGGTVTFGVDCTDLVLKKTVVVGAGATLDIEGNGHTVVLDGASTRRLFLVAGGTLTVNGVTLENGRVFGANGAAG